MKAGEPHVHSFVIRVWQEKVDEDDSIHWRGHITHVPGGERIYVQELVDILDFVVPYIESMGVRDIGYPCRSNRSEE